MSNVNRNKGDLLFSVKNMTKTFGPVVALNNVSLEVRRGESVGLIGETGSGKSTVSSIAAGMQKADSGEMTFMGNPWNPASMIDALEKGVGMIVQESGTIAGVTVAENIFLGEIQRFSRFGFVNRKALYQAADEALRKIGITDIPSSTMMGALDFQLKKLIEIAKVVMKEPEILIVDETTTALSQRGREILYRIIQQYADENRAVILISHDLDEIMERCTSLTVLRDGNIIRTFTKDEFDPDQIKLSMIGRELTGNYYRADFDPTWQPGVAISLEHVSVKGHLFDISLEAHKGEILGIGGLSHCGMHTLGKVFFGAIKPNEGKVLAEGIEIRDEHQATKRKIGYVSKDRDAESLVLSASVKDNISIAGLSTFAIGNFLVLPHKENAYVQEQIDSLSIKCSDKDQIVQTLSGGNKQKVVFGKWVGCGSNILVLDCPTRGVDIGVKQAMYQLMIKLKNEGKTIIMISEELPELLGMSDRLIIMKDGRIAKEFLRSSTLSDSEIINYMI